MRNGSLIVSMTGADVVWALKRRVEVPIERWGFEFWFVREAEWLLAVELQNQHFRRLVLEVPSPDGMVALIRGELLR